MMIQLSCRKVVVIMAQQKRDLSRVNINLPTSLVNDVKKYADSLGLPVTQAYTVLINMALEQKEMLNSMPELIKAVSDLKEISNVNDSEGLK